MKVVIFCGGLGTRLREETEFRPKPMVPVGERPILWHIMKTYAHYGHNEFVLCLGYKGEVIKEYFRNYHWNTSDVTLRLGARPQIKYHNQHDEEDWSVTLVDTGQATMTGGRLKRVLKFIDEDDFLVTYGDGLTDSNINNSITFHGNQKKVVTITAVRPAGRFGDLEIADGTVRAFQEKAEHQPGFINGGFFVMNKRIGQYLTDDTCVLEQEPLARLAAEGQIAAYCHSGFWQCMDTYREQQMLTGMWNSGKAPWRVWANNK
jgi:glucose-1-phosphate cytidylyltransferase